MTESPAVLARQVDVTRVTLTGTGIPEPVPGRAGPGTLVRFGRTALQFDAGRATVLRLTEADCPPSSLSALFVTHVHSDHVVDLADVVMSRWIMDVVYGAGPLPVVAPEGVTADFVRRMLEPFRDDLALRAEHVHSAPIRIDLDSFDPPSAPAEVWSSQTDPVRVEAVKVHHEPVPDAVAYRVTTPTGVVVVSGDTRVCDEVEDLARGADLLVHEACRPRAFGALARGTILEEILGYHADTVALGALVERAGVRHTVLTHLLPQPRDPESEALFAAELREGGYKGTITVGSDLVTLTVPPRG